LLLQVAEKQGVVISTIHVWRCGKDLLNGLLTAGVLPEECVTRRGPLVRLKKNIAPAIKAAVTAHLSG
jgi:hypothetical protein